MTCLYRRRTVAQPSRRTGSEIGENLDAYSRNVDQYRRPPTCKRQQGHFGLISVLARRLTHGAINAEMGLTQDIFVGKS
jgi:hypothetical protein